MNLVISAIICTHNRAKYLRKSIQSLLDQRTPKDQYEIVIVDNCSSDNTQKVVKQFSRAYNIKYFYETSLGLSYARNTGWRNAMGKYVAYLDDDAIASPVWLDKIIEVFETTQPNLGCVGGKVEPLWEASRPPWLSNQLMTALTVIDWPDKPHFISDLSLEWLVGANIAFPKHVLESIGGFTHELDRVGKKLLSSGDVFMTKQIVKAGYSCFYHPEITISHFVPKSRLDKRWFVSRYYSQGLSDAVMQLLEEKPSFLRLLHVAISKTFRLFRKPSKLLKLLLPANNPEQFTEKCFMLIAVGHIAGLLKAIKR